MGTSGQTSHSKSILCIDDDEDTCELFQIILSEYDFTSAHSTGEAMRLIENKRFDLYIFDNWMPGGSGIQLCRKVRSLGFTAPIVFISGAVQQKEIEEALASGADKYLTKPCEPSLLRKVVKELIG